MFLTAYEFFKDERYLQVALESGEVIWHRGLILKGNGLCHGITGNTYPFLTLANFTKDNKWKVRAYLFALLSFQEEVVDLVK